MKADGRVFMASDVGGKATLDLRIFARDRCDVMREVWEQVPIAWGDGRPVPAAPPPFHECAGL